MNTMDTSFRAINCIRFQGRDVSVLDFGELHSSFIKIFVKRIHGSFLQMFQKSNKSRFRSEVAAMTECLRSTRSGESDL